MAIRVRWILAGLACVAARAPAQGSSTCKPADAYTAELLPYLDSLVTQTDTSYAKFRKQLQLLPTTSGNVGLVTTQAICARAAARVDSIMKTPGSGRSVYVFKLGPTRYGVSDPTSGGLPLQKGDRLLIFFTSTFRYLSGVNH